MRSELPEIILFDYGKTLAASDGFDMRRGIEKLWEHITENPRDITPEQAESFVWKIYEKLDVYRKAGCEIPQQNEMRLAYEFLGIGFDLPYSELELIFRDGGSAAHPMEGAPQLLAYLERRGIRSGVVSNINWSGKILKERINSLFPDNRFEFVIATSDYVIRKPDSMIFELALRKAGVPAEKAWFCGDDADADIIGAHSAGIFPVYITGGNEDKITFEHLAVKSIGELISVLDKI